MRKIGEILLLMLIYVIVEAIHYLAFSLSNLTFDITKYSQLTLNCAAFQFFMASMTFLIYFFMIACGGLDNDKQNTK